MFIFFNFSGVLFKLNKVCVFFLSSLTLISEKESWNKVKIILSPPQQKIVHIVINKSKGFLHRNKSTQTMLFCVFFCYRKENYSVKNEKFWMINFPVFCVLCFVFNDIIAVKLSFTDKNFVCFISTIVPHQQPKKR